MLKKFKFSAKLGKQPILGMCDVISVLNDFVKVQLGSLCAKTYAQVGQGGHFMPPPPHLSHGAKPKTPGVNRVKVLEIEKKQAKLAKISPPKIISLKVRLSNVRLDTSQYGK